MTTATVVVCVYTEKRWTDIVAAVESVAALVAGADFAKGSRFAAGGGSDDITPLRNAGNAGLNLVANTLFGTTNLRTFADGTRVLRTLLVERFGGRRRTADALAPAAEL